MTLTIAGSLFAWAWTAFLLAPALVTRRGWAVHHPGAALTTWAVLFVTGAIGSVVGLALALRSAAEVSSATAAGRSPLSTCDSCHDAAVFGASWLMTVVVGGGLLLAGYRAAGLLLRRHRAGRLAREACGRLPRHPSPPMVIDRPRGGAVPVAVLTSDRLLASCAPGRNPHVVVSSAMRDLLSAEELRAVVAHECAHLGRWHGLLLGLAGLQRDCLSGLARAGEAHRGIALLVELAADDRAARHCGASVTATALRKVAEASGDDTMRLRAHRTALASA